MLLVKRTMPIKMLPRRRSESMPSSFFKCLGKSMEVMMIEHPFGGTWTDQKLKKIGRYLPAYTNILKDKGFTIGYIDAFAGTGYRTLRSSCPDVPGLFDELEDSDAQGYRDGSARIALDTDPPFDRYIFIEKEIGKCTELEQLKNNLLLPRR
jgi:three-Cys-motif partner protein